MKLLVLILVLTASGCGTDATQNGGNKTTTGTQTESTTTTGTQTSTGTITATDTGTSTQSVSDTGTGSSTSTATAAVKPMAQVAAEAEAAKAMGDPVDLTDASQTSEIPGIPGYIVPHLDPSNPATARRFETFDDGSRIEVKKFILDGKLAGIKGGWLTKEEVAHGGYIAPEHRVSINIETDGYGDWRLIVVPSPLTMAAECIGYTGHEVVHSGWVTPLDRCP